MPDLNALAYGAFAVVTNIINATAGLGWQGLLGIAIIFSVAYSEATR